MSHKSLETVERLRRNQKRYRDKHKNDLVWKQKRKESNEKSYFKNREKRLKTMNNYYLNHKEEALEYSRKWRNENRERVNELGKIQQREWRAKHPHVDRDRRRKWRIEVLTHYGGDPPKCKMCGESHIEFLTIDHIDGGGKQHRKQIKNNTYRWLINNNFPKGFQVLCMNCQFFKEKKNYKEYYLKVKLELLNHYSNGNMICSCCGEFRIECLAIDHIDGNGRKHRKKIGKEGFNFYLWLRKNGFPDGYRVLCHNCNSSFGLYGKCPHNQKI